MNSKRIAHIFCLVLISASWPAPAADTQRLTLAESVRLALSQNRALKIARLKVAENEQKKAGTKASYFPEIRNDSNFLHTTSVENVGIPRGAFGPVPGGGVVPARDILIDQGNQTFVTSGTTLAQPLTQLIRIRQANRVAAAETAASREELRKAENEVAVRVHEVYFGILVAHLQKRAADQESAYADTRLRESEEDVRNGNALKVAAIESRAGLLQSEQSALTAELQLADLSAELNDLLGLPLDTPVELMPVQTSGLTPSAAEPPRDEFLKLAYLQSPEIKAAAEIVEKARAGVTAAKSAYIPDVSAIAAQSYQNGVPFLVHNFGTFGLNLKYDVFDFGKRRAAVREREAQLAQARENLERVKEAVAVRIERSYNRVARARHMLQVANEVVVRRTACREPDGAGRGTGFGAAPGFRSQLQSGGGPSAGSIGIPARRRGAGRNSRAHPGLLKTPSKQGEYL